MMDTLTKLPADIIRRRVLTTGEAAAFCRFSIPHWRRLYRAGKVPRPVRLSARKYGWRIGDLVDWIEASRAEATENWNRPLPSQSP
jgi:predicted DNA-binding transcriptional regulator AlpA